MVRKRARQTLRASSHDCVNIRPQRLYDHERCQGEVRVLPTGVRYGVQCLNLQEAQKILDLHSLNASPVHTITVDGFSMPLSAIDSWIKSKEEHPRLQQR